MPESEPRLSRGASLDDLHAVLTPRKSRGDDSLCFWAVGLGEEAGEVLGQCKKMVRDHKIPNPPPNGRDTQLLDEVGDVLFYLRQILAKRGLTLQDAADSIVAKLDAVGPPIQ